nr:hypothetical protein [Alcanivorax sp. DP30]
MLGRACRGAALLGVCCSPAVNAAPGDLSADFGDAGVARTNIAQYQANHGAARATIELANGKLLVAGNGGNGVNRDLSVTRLNADGSLDSSFGNGGTVQTAINIHNDTAVSVVEQPDGKVVALGQGFDGQYTRMTLVRYLVDGSIDASFGEQGFAMLPSAATGEVPASVAIQSDGKLLVAGHGSINGNTELLVARYNADGSPDLSFGNNGLVAVGASTSWNTATSALIQSDGKIVVAGYSDAVTGSYDPAVSVVRLNADGSLDSGFAVGGKLLINMSSYGEQIYAMAQQADGKLLLSGRIETASNGASAFLAVRLNTDGSLDSGFGSGGKALHSVSSAYNYSSSVAIQADGKIIAAGRRYNGSNSDMALLRYNANGSLDTSFGSNGLVSHAYGASRDVALGVAVLDSGRIVTVGDSYNGSNDEAAIVAFTAAGAVDASFGNNGKVTLSGGGSIDTANQSIELASGGFLQVGQTRDGVDTAAAFARFLADGTADTTFGNDGIATFSLSGQELDANAAVELADGRYLIAGEIRPVAPGYSDALLLMLNPDGSVDTGFGTSGYLQLDISQYNDNLEALIELGDGKLLALGDWQNGQQIQMVRFNADGSLDTSFNGTGEKVVDLSSSYDYVSDVVPAKDGGLLLAGRRGGNVGLVAKLDGQADLESGFGMNGILTFQVDGRNTVLAGLAELADGSIVVTGYAYNGSDNDVLIAQLQANGSFESGFADDGVMLVNLSSGNDEGQSIQEVSASHWLVAANTGSAVTDVALIDIKDGVLNDQFGASGIQTLNVGLTDSVTNIMMHRSGFATIAGHTVTPGDFFLAGMEVIADSDADGVHDELDAFPANDAAEQDDDFDGLPDAWNPACDAACQSASGLVLDAYPGDSDNDGAANDTDAFPNDPAETEDSDNDGAGDNSDAFPDDNAAATDADEDGYPDDWNPDCDAACQSASGLTLDPLLDDNDNDGIPDGEDNVPGDNNPPTVIAPADIQLVATGDLTDVNLGMAGASDINGTATTPANDVVLTEGGVKLPPGRTVVTWTATDGNGNVGSAEQVVEITPLARFDLSSQIVGEGSVVTVTVSLNGDAVAYPVTLPVIISGGTATEDDHTAQAQSLVIESDAEPANRASFAFLAVDDGLTGEADDTLSFDLVEDSGEAVLSHAAVDAARSRHTVTLTELNVAPVISGVRIQEGELTEENEGIVIGEEEIDGHTIIRRDQTVTLTALLEDANPLDTHNYQWQINGEIQLSDGPQLVLEMSEYAVGEYIVAVQALDSGVPMEYSNALSTTVTLRNPPAPSTTGGGGSSGGGSLHWGLLLLAMLGGMRRLSR